MKSKISSLKATVAVLALTLIAAPSCYEEFAQCQACTACKAFETVVGPESVEFYVDVILADGGYYDQDNLQYWYIAENYAELSFDNFFRCAFEMRVVGTSRGQWRSDFCDGILDIATHENDVRGVFRCDIMTVEFLIRETKGQSAP